MMQQMELQRMINSFYEEQGKAERIKKIPAQAIRRLWFCICLHLRFSFAFWYCG